MVEYQTATLARTFSALSAPVRLALLEELRHGSRTVLELAAPFDVSLNAVSKHLKVLEGAGLVRRDVRGREHHISLAPDSLRDVGDYAEHFRRFWEERLDALGHVLSERRRRDGRHDHRVDHNDREVSDGKD